MEIFTDPQAWVSLLTLTVLEIVLGIDNVVFISILAAKLPANQQDRARRLGLSLALGTRVLLLLGLTWMVRLTSPLFHIPQVLMMEAPHPVSGRDLILLVGGLFLLFKAVKELHDKLEGEDGAASATVAPTFSAVIVQILLLDVVFSLDSVITAVGMADEVAVMIAAVVIAMVVIAMVVMLVFAGRISAYIERHPTLKILALSFLLLIGFTLVAEGFHVEIPKGYIYFSMAFAVGVEMLNLRMRRVGKSKVELHQSYR